MFGKNQKKKEKELPILDIKQEMVEDNSKIEVDPGKELYDDGMSLILESFKSVFPYDKKMSYGEVLALIARLSSFMDKFLQLFYGIGDMNSILAALEITGKSEDIHHVSEAFDYLVEKAQTSLPVSVRNRNEELIGLRNEKNKILKELEQLVDKKSEFESHNSELENKKDKLFRENKELQQKNEELEKQIQNLQKMRDDFLLVNQNNAYIEWVKAEDDDMIMGVTHHTAKDYYEYIVQQYMVIYGIDKEKAKQQIVANSPSLLLLLKMLMNEKNFEYSPLSYLCSKYSTFANIYSSLLVPKIVRKENINMKSSETSRHS